MNQGVDALITALKSGDSKKIADATDKIRKTQTSSIRITVLQLTINQ